MKAAFAALVLAFAVLSPTSSLPQARNDALPALTARVVDAAAILKPEDRAAVEAKLKAHEDKTSDQVVVATVPSLGGSTVEDYANRLFRAWALGEKARNNGVLLLVAPTARKIRIEVGYGLEGALTDALTKVIITTAIAPRFKDGDFAGGLNAGVDAILSILTGDAEVWQRRARVRGDDVTAGDMLFALLVLAVIFFLVFRMMRGAGGQGMRAHRRRNGSWLPIPIGGGGWGGGGGFSGGAFSGGGSFSGGGGSSGGGGASGGW